MQDSILKDPEAISAAALRGIDEQGTLRLTGCPHLPLLSERARLLREVRYDCRPLIPLLGQGFCLSTSKLHTIHFFVGLLGSFLLVDAQIELAF